MLKNRVKRQVKIFSAFVARSRRKKSSINCVHAAVCLNSPITSSRLPRDQIIYESREEIFCSIFAEVFSTLNRTYVRSAAIFIPCINISKCRNIRRARTSFSISWHLLAGRLSNFAVKADGCKFHLLFLIKKTYVAGISNKDTTPRRLILSPKPLLFLTNYTKIRPQTAYYEIPFAGIFPKSEKNTSYFLAEIFIKFHLVFFIYSRKTSKKHRISSTKNISNSLDCSNFFIS